MISMLPTSPLLLLFCATSAFAGLLPEELALKGKMPVCSDERGPLLDTSGVRTCNDGCPDGFLCEFQDAEHSDAKGICCPDLDRLEQLYGDAKSSTEQKEKSTTAKVALAGENDQRREIRRVKDTSIDDIFAKSTEGIGVRQLPTTQEICKRKDYGLLCPDGKRIPQKVIRWYVCYGMCCPYVYGYCEKSIAFDTTVRLKSECEAVCLKKSKNRRISGEANDTKSDRESETASGGNPEKKPSSKTGTSSDLSTSIAESASSEEYQPPRVVKIDSAASIQPSLYSLDDEATVQPSSSSPTESSVAHSLS